LLRGIGALPHEVAGKFDDGAALFDIEQVKPFAQGGNFVITHASLIGMGAERVPHLAPVGTVRARQPDDLVHKLALDFSDLAPVLSSHLDDRVTYRFPQPLVALVAEEIERPIRGLGVAHGGRFWRSGYPRAIEAIKSGISSES
jgi:hypothetical protein